MKLELSAKVLISALAIILIFILFRGFQFAQSITSFLSEHFWDAIF